MYLFGRITHLIPQDIWFLKGLFTGCHFDCEFFIATNGLYGIRLKCSGGVIVTVTLNPMVPIIGNTLGPAYNEFGYYEHPSITSKYLQRVPLVTSIFS